MLERPRLRHLPVLAFRAPAAVLAATVLLTALAAYSGIVGLRIDADLAALLPEDLPSVVGIRELQREIGSPFTINLVVDQAEPEQLERFIDEIGPKLEAHPHVKEVYGRRPIAFFEHRALYFLELEKLQTLDKRLLKRKKWEYRKRNPLFVGLGDDEGPPDLGLDALLSDEDDRAGELLGQDGEEPYLMDREGKRALVVIYPESGELNLRSDARNVAAVEHILASTDLSPYGPPRIRMAGGVLKREQQRRRIESDLGLASAVALVLIVLYLVVLFRRVTSVGLIMGPLLIGITWTYGLAAAMYESLNVLTAFVSVMLLGVGLDHGVHLLSRLEATWPELDDPADAISESFRHTGAAVLLATLTTALGFLGLAFSDFRVFYEFGTIAAIGITSIALVYLIVLPALLGALHELGWNPRARNEEDSLRSPLAWPLRAPAATLLVVLVGALMLSSQLTKVSFNYSTRALGGELEAYAFEPFVQKMLGSSQALVAVMAKSSDDAKAVTEVLRARRRQEGQASTIGRLATIADVLPPQQQGKRALIASIAKTVGKVDLREIEDKRARRVLERLRDQGVPEPFGFEQLPRTVRNRFTGKTPGLHERLVLIYSSLTDLGDARQSKAFGADVTGIDLADGQRYDAVGPPLIAGDVVDMVFAESPRIGALVMVMVFVAVLLGARSLWVALLSCLVAGLTMTMGAGTMALLGVQLNYINVAIIAVIFGMSVDGALHLLLRQREHSGELEVALVEVNRANVGALVTTGLGFGAMTLATHPGIVSLAHVALIGIGANVLLNVLALPAFLAWRAR